MRSATRLFNEPRRCVQPAVATTMGATNNIASSASHAHLSPRLIIKHAHAERLQ
jgi:hypothetical protein